MPLWFGIVTLGLTCVTLIVNVAMGIVLNRVSATTANVLRTNQPSHLAIVVAMHDCEFRFMEEVVGAFMKASSGNVGYGDSTGIGMASNESLAKLFKGRWTPHTFTAAGKAEVASALKTAFRDGTQTLPPLDGPYKLIATDVYAVQRDDTSGRVSISETPNPLLDESHCDIAYSIGLARLAGARSFVPPLPQGNKKKPVGL